MQSPTDPPDKGRRPVIVVSSESRNIRDSADTVLVIPLSTSVHKADNPDNPMHLLLLAGETGLPADSIARAQDIATVRKTQLAPPRMGLRIVSHRRICELSSMVKIAMGC